MLRWLTRLRARLHRLILGDEMRLSKAAAGILGLDLRKRQLSSTNRVVAEGRGATIHIVNFADRD